MAFSPAASIPTAHKPARTGARVDDVAFADDHDVEQYLRALEKERYVHLHNHMGRAIDDT